MRIFFTTDDKLCVYPCCDDSGQEPEAGWYSGEIDGSAYETHGIPIYKYVDGRITDRTESEIQADIDAMPVPEPTEAELLRADIDYLLMLAGEE